MSRESGRVYVTFEGVDGAGKTRQVEIFCEQMVKSYYTPIRLAEPTHGPFGSLIRKHIEDGSDLTVEKQVKLFTEDRRDHVRDKIEPLLKFLGQYESFVMVQDRYYLSAPAYQGRDEKSMLTLLRQQQAIAPRPDIVFLLDVPAEVAVARVKEAHKGRQMFESIDFLKGVRERYLALAEEGSEPIEVIDAEATESEVAARIMEILDLEPWRP